MSSPSRFCTQCGAQLPTGARFCNQCGAPVRTATAEGAAPPAPPAYTPPPAPAPPPLVAYAPAAQSAEPILSITTGVTRAKGFLNMGQANYVLVLTPSRMIFAHLSTKAMNRLVTEARDAAKAEGKGFFKQAAAQMGWLNLLVERFRSMSPDRILAQDPESFFIPNASVSRVRLRRVVDSSDQSYNSDHTRMTVESAAGKQRFSLQSNSSTSHRQLKQRLEQALGAIVRG